MAFQGDSIFWVDTDKVVPNPFQPRREFDQAKLQELSESIRMYGVLQPLTVTRSEVQNEDGTFYTRYELIAGERRLRASRLALVPQVPVIIREGEQSEQEKLELAIIENLQREDLNAVDRALAFQQLAEQFAMSHTQVAQKVGRSREYVSNSIRLLGLPEHMRIALQRGELGEGHARTLLMLTDRKEEQETIFREILLKKMSVREVERIVRKIAVDKVRKPNAHDIGDNLLEFEKSFTETLGTRVQIQKTEFGGKLTIDYFSEDDLSAILKRMQAEAGGREPQSAVSAMAAVVAATPLEVVPEQLTNQVTPEVLPATEPVSPIDEPEPKPQMVAEPVSVLTPVERPSELAIPAPAVNPPLAAVASPVPATSTAAPQADPGLLAKLAAHTSFGFSRPAPAHQPTIEPFVSRPVAAPAPEQQSTPDPTPTPPAAPAVIPATETPTPTPKPAESEEDIYSIRNFSI
jgi:ParB family chromosome partitioning protein